MHNGVQHAERYSPRYAFATDATANSKLLLSFTCLSSVQLCSICEDNDDIVLLKVDWDQNKPIARPLGVKVRNKFSGKASVD